MLSGQKQFQSLINELFHDIVMIIAYAKTRSIGRLLPVGVKLKAGPSLFKQYHPTLDKQMKRQRVVCINIKQEAPSKFCGPARF